MLITMKRSPERHPLAVLRLKLGLLQKELANLVGCSPSTIQSIELNSGRLKLSEKLAERISSETGVNLSWLMNDEVKEPIIDRREQPYTNEIFEIFQAEKRRPKTSLIDYSQAEYALEPAMRGIAACLVAGFKQEKLSITIYRLDKAVNELMRSLNVTCGEKGNSLTEAELEAEFESESESELEEFQVSRITKIFKRFKQELKREQKAKKAFEMPANVSGYFGSSDGTLIPMTNIDDVFNPSEK